MTYPKKRIKITIEVIETTEGKHSVHHTINEYDTTMTSTGLALYKMKQIEQEFIDRIYDDGGEGYEIIQEDEG